MPSHGPINRQTQDLINYHEGEIRAQQPQPIPPRAAKQAEPQPPPAPAQSAEYAGHVEKKRIPHMWQLVPSDHCRGSAVDRLFVFLFY